MEGFYGRRYVGVNGYYFQNIREGVDGKKVPTVLPATSFSYFSPTMAYDSYFHVTGDTLSLRRNRGNDMNLLSTTTAWVLPYTTQHGSVYEFKTFLRGDYYDIRKYDPNGPFGEVNGGMGRAIPGASLVWRFPFMTYLQSSRWVIEPVAKLVAKPSNLNNLKIPNEDSQDFEFDARNLFADNRLLVMTWWMKGNMPATVLTLTRIRFMVLIFVLLLGKVTTSLKRGNSQRKVACVRALLITWVA